MGAAYACALLALLQLKLAANTGFRFHQLRDCLASSSVKSLPGCGRVGTYPVSRARRGFSPDACSLLLVQHINHKPQAAIEGLWQLTPPLSSTFTAELCSS